MSSAYRRDDGMIVIRMEARVGVCGRCDEPYHQAVTHLRPGRASGVGAYGRCTIKGCSCPQWILLK